VRTVAGRKGGYGLAREPDELRLYDLVAALDGAPPEGCCLLSVGGCSNQTGCGVHDVIAEAEEVFYAFLRAETAASLARKMFRDRGPLGGPAWDERPEA
jgi:DNA-binding IscR family transcriptional regulator